MLNIPSMKLANPKELITFALQLHDSVSKLAHGEEVSELSSQGNIRFMIMKLTPHLQVKWGAKCYDVRQVIVLLQRQQREFQPTKDADN